MSFRSCYDTTDVLKFRDNSFFSTRHGSHHGKHSGKHAPRYRYDATSTFPFFKDQICVQRRGLPETIRVSKKYPSAQATLQVCGWSFLHVTVLFDLLQRRWCFQTRRQHTIFLAYHSKCNISRFNCVHQRGRSPQSKTARPK